MAENLTQDERYQRGMKKVAELGATPESSASGMMNVLNSIAPHVTRYSMEFVLGDVLSRPGLDTKTREMLNVAVLTVLQTPIELALHINGALNCGVTRDEVVEIVSQQIVYAGFPIAINGLHVVKEVFDDRDKKGLS